MIDDIDLGGQVVGVVRVPSEPVILCDQPEPEIKPIQKIASSRNPVDVRHWDGDNFVFTLTAGVRLSRKALSDCIAEWKIAHPRIDRVRCYVSRHPLMNLPIHVLHHCGFVRTGGELMWERDMTKRTELKPESRPSEPKSEPEWDAWAEELASLRKLQEFCAANKIIFVQRELDRIQWLELKIREQEEFRREVQATPEYQALEAQQRENQIELDQLQKRLGTS